jgi:hypothetical protein
VGIAAQTTANFLAVYIGHIEVKDQQMGLDLIDLLQRLEAPFGRQDFITGLLQQGRTQL